MFTSVFPLVYYLCHFSKSILIVQELAGVMGPSVDFLQFLLCLQESSF